MRVTPQPLLPLWDRAIAPSLASRLGRGAFWSSVCASASQGLSLVSLIVIARLLGKVGFGELTVIQSTVTMFGTFAGFGLGLTATKSIAEYRHTGAARAGRTRALPNAAA